MEGVYDELKRRAPQVNVMQRISTEDVAELIQLVQDWSAAHGLVVADSDSDKVTWRGSSVTLSPSCVPQSCFDFGVEIAPYFSLLFHRISLHPTFLQETLKSVISGDIFTRNLLRIYQTCRDEGFEQKLSLGIYRSDYMIDLSLSNGNINARLLQIEVNAVSAAFSHLGHLATKLHKYLISTRPHLYKGICVDNIPDNESHLLVPNALQTAHKAFLEQRKDKLEENLRVVVLLIAQPGERNRIDQRHIEFSLFEKHGVSLVRSSLIDVYHNARLSPLKNLILNVHGEEVIASVVYFRAGYTPDDFPSEKEWDARLLIEKSSAIKGPSISLHLCGTKRVQQVLADPKVLRSFFGEDEKSMADKLLESFVGMYDLDRNGSFVEKHKEAMENPENFVMKPQREGGGSLLVGEKITEALKTWDDDQLNSHILMERIRPVAMPNYLIFGGVITDCVDVIAEIGFFHSYLASEDTVLLNETKGYLVRTKPSSVDDGGVAAGRAALDSLCLCQFDTMNCCE